MIRVFLSIAFMCCVFPAFAEVVVAARNIRPGEVLSGSDILKIRGQAAGGFEDEAAVIGTEAKVALYAGRAILAAQIGPAASIERNQIVELVFTAHGLSMTTEGRALGRGSEGQRIRVMNLASKASLFGTIQRDGTIKVSQ